MRDAASENMDVSYVAYIFFLSVLLKKYKLLCSIADSLWLKLVSQWYRNNKLFNNHVGRLGSPSSSSRTSVPHFLLLPLCLLISLCLFLFFQNAVNERKNATGFFANDPTAFRTDLPGYSLKNYFFFCLRKPTFFVLPFAVLGKIGFTPKLDHISKTVREMLF